MVDKSTRTKMPWRTSVIGEKMCCPIDECDVVSTFMPRLLLLMLWCHLSTLMSVIIQDYCYDALLKI